MDRDPLSPASPSNTKRTSSAYTRKASSFPASFLKVFLKAASSENPLVIDTLSENRKGAYIALRARLNAFRKAYADDAEESRDVGALSITSQIYAVTICNPEEHNGKWSMTMRPRAYKYIEALDEAIGNFDLEFAGTATPATETLEELLAATVHEPVPEPEPSSPSNPLSGRPLVESKGGAAISELFGEPEPETAPETAKDA